VSYTSLSKKKKERKKRPKEGRPSKQVHVEMLFNVFDGKRDG